jgi:predicted CopG family antitoxin
MSRQQLLNSSSKKKDKTLKVSQEAHDELDDVGKKGESYNDIILRLVKFYKEHQQ